MRAKNKWNKKTYEIVKVSDKDVTLKRPDGSVFTIAKSEFYFTYVELK